MKSTLRPHQKHAMSLIAQSLGSGSRKVMCQAPTGFGKTVLACRVAEQAMERGKRMIMCVPAISLIDQTVEALAHEGITDVGVLQGNHPLTRVHAPIQVASVQTLQNRRIPHADIVLIDEAHRWFKFYEDWLSKWDATPFVGLSATPWTKGLGKHWDDLVIASTTQELIDAGYLADFDVYAPSHPDLSGVKTVAGDYHEGQLSEAMQPLTADVVTTWLQHAEDRPTLVFGVDRAHAQNLQQRFQAAGVPAGYIDAYTDRQERESIRRQFESGSLKVVCNVGCLTTGVDWDVRCIVLARPTRSEMLFVQIIGRGLRTAPGKDKCLILDHSDTHLRLGFVTDIHHDELDMGKHAESGKRDHKESLPQECAKCHFLKPPRVGKCPRCGFKAQKQTDIEEADGALKPLARKRASTPDREAVYRQLLGHAERHGYKPGWAFHKYQEIYERQPASTFSKEPMDPDPEIASWIRSRQIAWAKSQRKSA